ncbi:MAG: biotin-dependent carboxyltransferase family protein [Pseudonocardia sp.]|nr:biotin-dependent carboxyltransferase family protein [Pseudonocardia sp.]
MRALEVLSTGPQALVQDLGRPGHAASGVGRSGAADRAALWLGNRLVANPEGAAGIEIVLGGFAVRAAALLTVALTGAAAPATVDGRPVGHHAVILLRRGQELRLGTPPAGLRTYLAVRGGIEVPPVLGSRSTDVLSGIGPAPLAKGDELPVGPEPEAFPLVDVAPVAPPPAGAVTLRVVAGPRDEHAADPRGLAGVAWTASSRTDRVGMRLEGGTLAVPDGAGSLPSEGIGRGAVQLPPGGAPVVFLADHPVTGGYPVIAVVLDADTDRAAQVRPGQPVRFRYVGGVS